MGVDGIDKADIFDEYFDDDKPKITNFQRIKAMDIDEMVRWLWKITDCECCEASKKDCCFGAGKCERTLKQWLESEVRE